MSESDAKIDSEENRLLDDTNYNFNQLSANYDSIWSKYFSNLFSSITEDVAKTLEQEDRQNINDRSELAERLATISEFKGDLAKQSSAEYERRFIGRETFHGYVVGLEESKFIATIEDHSGDQYEYTFFAEELPHGQRDKIRIGVPIVVHGGYEYRKGTVRNMLKIYLSDYKTKSVYTDTIIEDKISLWDF